jgi:hypothetical protein
MQLVPLQRGQAAHRPKRLNPSGWDMLMKDTAGLYELNAVDP